MILVFIDADGDAFGISIEGATELTPDVINAGWKKLYACIKDGGLKPTMPCTYKGIEEVK